MNTFSSNLNNAVLANSMFPWKFVIRIDSTPCPRLVIVNSAKYERELVYTFGFNGCTERLVCAHDVRHH